MSRDKPSEIDDNERDIVLGNKQLLSVFFVVVVLLGVFFTIGYVVGRNSTTPDVSAGAQQTGQIVETSAAHEAVPARPSALVQAEVEPPAAAATVRVQPPAAVAPPVRRAAEVPQLTVIQPAVGQMYLQVLAVAKAEAEVLAEVLAKKGFRALVAPGPNERVFRVLVGPAKDSGDASRLKKDLESAGFKPFVKKY